MAPRKQDRRQVWQSCPICGGGWERYCGFTRCAECGHLSHHVIAPASDSGSAAPVNGGWLRTSDEYRPAREPVHDPSRRRWARRERDTTRHLDQELWALPLSKIGEL